MVSPGETEGIHGFVCAQLRDNPDLSTLTLGILKRRYLAQAACKSLSPEAKNYMRQIVEEELMKMQDNASNGGELENKMPKNKRKRENGIDEVKSGSEDLDESRAKKSRYQSSSSSESEDKDDCMTGTEESEVEDKMKSGAEDNKHEVQKSQQKTNGDCERQNSEDSTDEERSESETKGDESNCSDSPEEMVEKKVNTTMNGETGSSDASPRSKAPHSDEEHETDTDSTSVKSEKKSSNESSDDSEKEEKVSTENKNNDQDSDSSSLPSLEDNQDSGTENNKDNKKRKTVKKGERTRGQKDENKAVVRLKRYISLCGVKRNYKKLLDGCRSVRSMVAVLKKELEDLGVQGQPSIKKCKKVRMKRERAQELAELDASNIIATQGRPKRRGASAWQEQRDPPSSAYQRTLNSGSDSDQENGTHRQRRRATDWTNLQGIISDDVDSD